ncbi:helix-turn-helix domain-containing protein [Streptomyces zagrosensis]|uniref:Transcriptional regulator with XRE-family HTH domain n=1 Tax=Streptomyces zagrosensis TaxID=1042984 RepID=A0A7W9Q839_9ACTN|nr:helix-turn-helix transcriptional regulator [Streptomyces zagrosensis]MBB5935348.1 transcriptional regulator with XRE-family HTH domain [Streptomyces zagrosensis]
MPSSDSDSGPRRAGPAPAALRRVIAARMRRLREAADLSLDEVAQVLRMTTMTVRRIEGAVSKPKLPVIKTLLQHYQAAIAQRPILEQLTDAAIADLLEMVDRATEANWWDTHPVASGWVADLLALESAAEQIREYATLVPVLLRTADYAAALAAGPLRGAPRLLDDLTPDRLAVLARTKGRLWMVIAEAGLRWTVGSPAVMRAQLDHLIELSTRPGVTIQLARSTQDPPPAALAGDHTYYRLRPDVLPDALVFPRGDRGELVDDPRTVTYYTELWDRTVGMAASKTETRALLKASRDDWNRE